MYHADTNQKKTGVTIWISDKADIRAKKLSMANWGITEATNGQFSKKTQQSLTSENRVSKYVR